MSKLDVILVSAVVSFAVTIVMELLLKPVFMARQERVKHVRDLLVEAGHLTRKLANHLKELKDGTPEADHELLQEVRSRVGEIRFDLRTEIPSNLYKLLETIEDLAVTPQSSRQPWKVELKEMAKTGELVARLLERYRGATLQWPKRQLPFKRRSVERRVAALGHSWTRNATLAKVDLEDIGLQVWSGPG